MYLRIYARSYIHSEKGSKTPLLAFVSGPRKINRIIQRIMQCNKSHPNTSIIH